jgi:hypothetical protein
VDPFDRGRCTVHVKLTPDPRGPAIGIGKDPAHGLPVSPSTSIYNAEDRATDGQSRRH